MLRLPDVTLVCVETRAHELARRTVMNALSKVDFGDVHIYTDYIEQIHVPGAAHFTVPDWPTKVECGKFITLESFKHVTTSHALFMEWDAGVWQSDVWTDEFLAYDFVGAVWPWRAERNVGNGGFSLRSSALNNYMPKFNSKGPWTDAQLCVAERPELEKKGFKWAPDYLAHKFAFERLQPSKDSRHFGFHGMFNWPQVLDRADLIERTRIAAKNPYVVSTNMVTALVQIAPWLKQEIG